MQPLMNQYQNQTPYPSLTPALSCVPPDIVYFCTSQSRLSIVDPDTIKSLRDDRQLILALSRLSKPAAMICSKLSEIVVGHSKEG